MRPGSVQKPESGKTVYVVAGVWLDGDGLIRVSFGREGLTAVADSPGHKQAHKELYAILKGVLVKTGRWNPPQGGEHF
jgi:hypothetical protein